MAKTLCWVKTKGSCYWLVKSLIFILFFTLSSSSCFCCLMKTQAKILLCCLLNRTDLTLVAFTVYLFLIWPTVWSQLSGWPWSYWQAVWCGHFYGLWEFGPYCGWHSGHRQEVHRVPEEEQYWSRQFHSFGENGGLERGDQEENHNVSIVKFSDMWFLSYVTHTIHDLPKWIMEKYVGGGDDDD